MPVQFQAWITRSDLRAHPERLYLFGDNEQREGVGGQAKAMRGEPNAVGIRTKRTPGTDETAYWSDANYAEHVRMLNEDFGPVLNRLLADPDLIVIIPKAGLGTGLAELEQRAPNTLRMIGNWIENLVHYDEVDDWSQNES